MLPQAGTAEQLNKNDFEHYAVFDKARKVSPNHY